jgi:hypothetical protein
MVPALAWAWLIGLPSWFPASPLHAMPKKTNETIGLLSPTITRPMCDEAHLYRNESQAGLPILSTALQNPDIQEIHLLFRYEINNDDFLNASWSCNGWPASEPFPSHWAANSDHQILFNLILVKCPILPESQKLSKVTVTTQRGKVYHYEDLESFVDCQINGHPASRILEQPTELVLASATASVPAPPLSHVVFSTMIQGLQAQAYLPQWIEYHHRVFGIPHFFVYVNEPWEIFKNRTSFQEWDFVTYVPFPLGYYHDDPFYYQRMQQNDMFWRIKILDSPLSKTRFGSQIQWVGMIDIDEYLSVPALNSSQIERWKSGTLYRDHLQSLLDQHSSSQDNGGRISALLFRNTFFGGPDAHHFEWTNAKGTANEILLCHFFHRDEPTWGRHPNWSRQKFFAQVDTAVYMNVHNVLSLTNESIIDLSSPGHPLSHDNQIWLDPETELRHNHFKLNFKGNRAILDTSLRDTFCEMMQAVVQIDTQGV